MTDRKNTLTVLLVVALTITAAVGYGAVAVAQDDSSNGTDDSGMSGMSESMSFTADLAGENEVPPVETDASGQATFELTTHGDEARLHYTLRVANIENVSQAHIHVGAPGENGPVVAFLFNASEPVDVSGETTLMEGTIQADDLIGPLEGMELSALAAEIRAGNTYVNVHTVEHPSGEIRGQIVPAEDEPATPTPAQNDSDMTGMVHSANFTADLAGENEVPPVETDASGQATFELSTHGDGPHLHYTLTVANIENVSQAHIHVGAPGENGPVVAFLFNASEPVDVSGEETIAEGTIRADDLIGPLEGMELSALAAEIRAGNTYVNVHTVQHPSGEIRGQIVPAEDEPAAPTASVVFENQTSEGTTVVVESVTMSEGGFVAIHETVDGGVGPVIGVSQFLEAGTHTDVTVTLFELPGAEFDQTALNGSQTLIAMPHLDTNGNQVYEFVSSNGAEDGPYVANGSAVVDSAFITVEVEDVKDDDEVPLVCEAGSTDEVLGENDEDDDGDGAIDEDDEDNEGPSNDDDDGDGAIDEDDECDDGDDGSDDFESDAEDDDDGDGHVDEDDEPDSGNSDDVDNDGDGHVDEDDEPDNDD